MGHICFGSFLKVLSLCSPRSTTNKFLCGTMFLAVNPDYDITEDDGTVGHLINCSNNVSPNITDNISTADPYEIRECFENKIIPKLSSDKRKHVVLALIDLLYKDIDIDQTVRIGTITENTKEFYKKKNQYYLAEVLTDFFFFVLQASENKDGRPYIDEITKDYIKSLSLDLEKITLLESRSVPGLTRSVRGNDFNIVFKPVTNYDLGLRNENDCQIFRLNIEDNEFTYSGIKRYLNRNIGRYVYSREEVERYRAEDDLESIGMYAAQYIRENSTGNELADMLLYAFLEEVLGAPKLLSSIELGSASNCSGIHLNTIMSEMPSYQMVYGSSKIEGDLKTAIDNAFESVVEIKRKRITGIQLVSGTAFSKSVDRQTALAVKEILIPSKQDQEPPGTAFGIFLGYSLGLKPEDYSAEEFAREVAKKMENDIEECASYIINKISELHLGMHSFYVYVLPFNNADEDKTSIINMLIGGTV